MHSVSKHKFVLNLQYLVGDFQSPSITVSDSTNMIQCLVIFSLWKNFTGEVGKVKLFSQLVYLCVLGKPPEKLKM